MKSAEGIKQIKVKDLWPNGPYQLAQTLVVKKGHGSGKDEARPGFLVSTVFESVDGEAFYRTMVFPRPHDYSGKKNGTYLEHLDKISPEIHRVILCNMTLEEAASNHRQAIEVSFRTLLACGL